MAGSIGESVKIPLVIIMLNSQGVETVYLDWGEGGDKAGAADSGDGGIAKLQVTLCSAPAGETDAETALCRRRLQTSFRGLR